MGVQKTKNKTFSQTLAVRLQGLSLLKVFAMCFGVLHLGNNSATKVLENLLLLLP